MHKQAPSSAQMEPYRRTVDDVVAALGTDRQSGLGQTQAQERLERYGQNQLIAETPLPKWRKFLTQFADVLVILLIIAASISGVLWFFERNSALPYDAIAIFAIVLLNALVGYFQQARAERALAALRQMSAAEATVMRDGSRKSIPATKLVPGDVILIEEGNTIPADARVIQSTGLQVAEAALTGESLPVSKDIAPIAEEAGLGDRHNMIFSGTAATYGRGRAVITATGMQTEMGRIAGMLKQAPKEVDGRRVWVQVGENLAHRDVIIDDTVADFFKRVGWITLPMLLCLLAIDILIFRRVLRPLLNASDPSSATALSKK
jgi:Ca2+-transporting ATPase